MGSKLFCFCVNSLRIQGLCALTIPLVLRKIGLYDSLWITHEPLSCWSMTNSFLHVIKSGHIFDNGNLKTRFALHLFPNRRLARYLYWLFSLYIYITCDDWIRNRFMWYLKPGYGFFAWKQDAAKALRICNVQEKFKLWNRVWVIDVQRFVYFAVELGFKVTMCQAQRRWDCAYL